MVSEIIKKQQEYFHEGHTKSFSFRLDQLQKLNDGIKKYESEIIDALKKDLNKPEFEAYTSEIGFLYESISYTKKHLKKWMKSERKRMPFHQIGSKGYLTYEPFGSVLIVGPFNYPFQLLIEPMIGAIASGNTVVLKPSEYTSHTESITVQLIKEVFDGSYIDIVTGGREITTELIHSNFDYIFFTGSVNVGKIVMKAAAEHLTPITLELGGKSPTIIDESAKVDLAAKRVAWGKFLNAGQTCIAPDYVYVHEKVADDFKVSLQKHITAFYGASVIDSPDYGRIVSKRHYDRLKALIDENKIFTGGKTDDETLFIEPTVLENVSWHDDVMAEEIFGPILPIMTYTDLNEVIKDINSRPKPLALYLFTENKEIEREILSRTSSGGVGINETITHIISPDLPFGGVGSSGMGAYHGKYSFLTFSHRKSVVKKSTSLDLKLVFPAYKDKIKFVKKVMK